MVQNNNNNNNNNDDDDDNNGLVSTFLKGSSTFVMN